MAQRVRKSKAKPKPQLESRLRRSRRGKKHSAGEIFMAVLGGALVIMFGVLILLSLFDLI